MRNLSCHKKIKKLLLLFILGGIVSHPLAGQQVDSLSALRDFISISRGYQQIPFYLEMEVRHSSNFITGEEDTATIEAAFYLQKEQSYVRFGEMEQFVNDTMALLVSYKMQTMILYPNAGNVVKQMRSLPGTGVPEASIQKIAARYSSKVGRSAKGITVIELKSREILYGTSFPKEEISMEYLTDTRVPTKIVNRKRILLPLDSLQYRELAKEAGMEKKLLATEEGYYLLKEQSSESVFKNFGPGIVKNIPVKMTDRIERAGGGQYKPVKKYEGYVLSIHDTMNNQ